MNETASVLFYLLLLILPIMALVARRTPLSVWLRYGLIWIAIFTGGTAILTTIL